MLKNHAAKFLSVTNNVAVQRDENVVARGSVILYKSKFLLDTFLGRGNEVLSETVRGGGGGGGGGGGIFRLGKLKDGINYFKTHIKLCFFVLFCFIVNFVLSFFFFFFVVSISKTPTSPVSGSNLIYP